MQAHLQHCQIKFVCQGHRIKVKVTGAKSVSACSVPAVNVECLDLDVHLFGMQALPIFRISKYCQGHLIKVTVTRASKRVCILFADGTELSSTEMQSCLLAHI